MSTTDELVARLRAYSEQANPSRIDGQGFACEAADAIETLQARITKLEADNARLREALTRIKYINHGPDKASGEWRCIEAAEIAAAALEATP